MTSSKRGKKNPEIISEKNQKVDLCLVYSSYEQRNKGRHGENK